LEKKGGEETGTPPPEDYEKKGKKANSLPFLWGTIKEKNASICGRKKKREERLTHPMMKKRKGYSF